MTGIEAVAQAIKTKCAMFQTEWWESTDEGLPFFAKILDQKDARIIDSAIKARILEVPNVISIVSYTSSLVKRAYTATAVVSTSFGSVTTGVTL